MSIKEEKNLYKKIINPVFLLKYGYYDINKTLDKRMDSLSEYTKSDYFPEDIFNMDDLVALIEDDINFSNFNASNLDRKTITEPVYFSIPKTNISRRELKMPNIYSYLNLMYFVVSNKNNIIQTFLDNKFSTSKYFGEFEYTYSITEQIRENKLQNGNKILKTDLSNFYHTLYTHSISWIIDGKNKAKLNKNKRNFSNDLDTMIRNCQYAETHGVPTGNLLTRILMEYYMCFFDKRMIEYDPNINYSRYVDDIQMSFNTDKQKEDFLLALRFNCREYYLTVNENKTSVENYPLRHVQDKKDIFLFFNDFNLKSSINTYIKKISNFCDFCEAEEACGNKGAIKSIFQVVINNIKKLPPKKVNKIFSRYNDISNFNLYEKFISLSLKDSKLSNRFIKFSKDLIKNGVDPNNESKIMNNYFKKNKNKIVESISFYKKNKFNQETYQILLYLVYFNINDFFSSCFLLDLISNESDDYSLCLSFILYYKNFYTKNFRFKKDMLTRLNKLFENIDSFYENKDPNTINTKFPIMAEKHWFFRYFIYSLVTQNIIEKQDLNKALTTNMAREKNGLNKTRLNPEYILNTHINPKNENILGFYRYLLHKNIRFVSQGKNNDFIFL